MLPRGMAVDESVSRKRRKKKTRSQKKLAASSSRARNKANDLLQNFDWDVNMDGLMADGDDDNAADGALEDDKFFDGVEDD